MSTVKVKVMVDVDELRHWAGKHADAGHVRMQQHLAQHALPHQARRARHQDSHRGMRRRNVRAVYRLGRSARHKGSGRIRRAGVALSRARAQRSLAMRA